MSLLDHIREVQQPRSRFQIERFVLGQHDTPEMRFYQLCIEAQQVIHALRHAELQERKTRLEIDRLRATGDEVDEVDADVKSLELEQAELAVIGARRELAILHDLYEEMGCRGEHYTREEIERAAPAYWEARLVRQAELQQLQAQTGVGWAHLDALRQAGAVPVLPQAPAPGGLPGGRT